MLWCKFRLVEDSQAYAAQQSKESLSHCAHHDHKLTFSSIYSTLEGVFSSHLKFFTPSHRMFGHMHGVLNVDEKITNYTDCYKFAR